METEGVSEGRDWHRTGAALVFALWRHALSGMKGLLVCWLADQWVTLCWHWYLSRKISPTDPIPVMHKKNDRSNIFVLVSLSFILFDQG